MTQAEQPIGQTALCKTWQTIIRENCSDPTALLRFFSVDREQTYADSVSRVANSVFPSPMAIEAEAVRAGIAQKGWAKLFFRGHIKCVLMAKGFAISEGDAINNFFADNFCASHGRGYKIAVFMMFFARIKAGACGRSYSKTDPTQIGEAFVKEFIPWYNAKLAALNGTANNGETKQDASRCCTMEEAEAILGTTFHNLRKYYTKQ